MRDKTLYTIGYGGWPTSTRMEQLLAALKQASITTLIDIRHAPCAPNPPGHGLERYQPKRWHLQPGGQGISAALEKMGIQYTWMVELGNPQKNDKLMTVMREQMDSCDLRSPIANQWPVQRGLQLLREICACQNTVVCLLCECGKYSECHRKLVAEKTLEVSENLTSVVDLSS